MKINTGLNETHRLEISHGLFKLLADTYLLYIKTQNFHWNVTGAHFKSLHELFESHYTELALAVDEIAERIRALGEYAPGSYEKFSKLSNIEEQTTVPDWKNMVIDLVIGHETVIKTARAMLDLVEKAKDEVTLGLLVDRLSVHEKTAWILRSFVA